MTFDLKAAMETIRCNVAANADFRIERVYIMYPEWIDYTIVVYPHNEKDDMSYQLLSTRDVELANKSELTVEDVQRYINNINKRGW